MEKALVCTDIAPLYSEATEACELADEALYGMEVDLLEEKDGLWLVRTHYSYEGYVPARCLMCTESWVRAWAMAAKVTVTAPYLDVLHRPAVQGYKLATVPRGGLLCPTGEVRDGWQQVALVDGRAGYVRASHMAPPPAPWRTRGEEELRDALCSAALAYRGTQYRWGGKTPLGIDCSGLTAMAYLAQGIIIYRDAAIKPEFEIREIPRDKMKRGDLLFFPGHVAMYIGEGKYVHSTGRAGDDGVVVNSLRPEDTDYREDLDKDMNAVGSVLP